MAWHGRCVNWSGIIAFGPGRDGPHGWGAWKGRIMGPKTIGFLAAGALLTVATPAAAQSPADTSFSESSRSSGPTCVVGGTASDCAGGSAAFPIVVTVSPVLSVPSSVASSPPLAGGIFGGSAVGDVSTDTDVDRSTSFGTAAAR
jgi:hypothetical protein